MDLIILMSTMNKKSIEDLKLKEKNILKDDNILVINQATAIENQMLENKNFLTYTERGLSKSRNRALEKVQEGIGIVADDDVCYKKNYKEIIKAAYKENKDADVIVFQIETPEKNLFKNYRKTSCYLNSFSILKVSSIEITFNIKKIKENCIKFDERFGLGAEYAIGEEAIFLKECLDKGLKILYLPKVLVIHPKESTGDRLDEEGLRNKGAVFQKIYKNKDILIGMIFILKKINAIEVNLFQGIKAFFSGRENYLKKIKEGL
ncbi:hypothetical protein [Cetobacterium somerae]|uniref:hypothetical protein n=1 Tax=Cetobacterium somerae TaxID=188913 RepID=UPI00248F1425|nr:hypothetical protein [Cetobacterium somerae]